LRVQAPLSLGTRQGPVRSTSGDAPQGDFSISCANVYANYFGLKEPSFCITPDPQYLFLSEQHREALAHLVYGTGEHGGFVLLTGEVGTGKTTVCRAFLEQLPDEVDVALILNPAMTVTELLRAVCDEFRVELSDDDRTVKRLVDRLNRFLLEAHARGRRAVLLIDESQNLRPKVLEQIRLLTNLETPKHKLLQIFLVGQPELRSLLQRPGLRQLNQRITARYHLRPFSAGETVAYVRHRLAVAGVDRPLFTRAALRRIHRISGGVPRLINILCDRALLGASVTRRPMVNRSIVNRAAAEIQDGQPWQGKADAPLRAAAAAFVLVLGFGGLWLLWQRTGMPDPPRPLVAMIEPWLPSVTDPGPADVQDGALEADPGASDLPRAAFAQSLPLAEASSAIDPRAVMLDRTTAMRLLLRRWGVELGNPGSQEPCARLESFGLSCEEDMGGWSRLRDFDRPALLRLRDADGNEGYAVLGALGAETATLDMPDRIETLSLADLNRLWLGEYLIVWQPPPVGTSVIGPGSSPQAVRWLRKLVSEVPDLGIQDNGSGRFDAGMEAAVRRFQTQSGLEADGIAGPRTLIRLHNAVDMPGPPRLREEG
jgi:general secretion pathway protein A